MKLIYENVLMENKNEKEKKPILQAQAHQEVKWNCRESIHCVNNTIDFYVCSYRYFMYYSFSKNTDKNNNSPKSTN